MISIWNILGIISIILLVIYWKKKSAVWGGFIGGIIVGLIIAVINLIGGNGFSWDIVKKGAIVGTLAGLLAELLGKIDDLLKERNRKKESLDSLRSIIERTNDKSLKKDLTAMYESVSKMSEEELQREEAELEQEAKEYFEQKRKQTDELNKAGH
jgi:hypothetical protein